MRSAAEGEGVFGVLALIVAETIAFPLHVTKLDLTIKGRPGRPAPDRHHYFRRLVTNALR
jgi:hypothetical protein